MNTKLFLSILVMISAASCAKKNALTLYTNCKLTAGSGPISIGGFPRNSNRIPSTGTVRVSVLMVDFPDAAATLTPAQAYAKVSGATATFTEMSYGRMTYTMTPSLTWLRMSQASSQYSYSSHQSHLAFAQEAVTLADAAVDFSTTDLLVVIANPDAPNIPSQGPTIATEPGFGITADGHEILNIITSGADLNSWGSIWLNHESTHALGLVDLYTYTPSENTLAGLLPFTGGFSYMGYNSFSSNAPGLTAWERWVLGWLDDSQMLCANPRAAGEINTLLTPLATSGGQKAVVIPVGDTKVVVVESRRASGIDANIAKTGAVVYSVDTSLDSGEGAIRVYPKGDSSDPLFTQSPRTTGESVTVSGVTIEVVSSTSSGDTVRITADKLWIDK